LGKSFARIEPAHRDFIARQRIFFAASATAASRVNVSPRGTDAFRVIDETTVAWLDKTGSGNETAAHVRADGRVTVMFCAFEGPPGILRLFGRGESLRVGTDAFEALRAGVFEGASPPGLRQIVRVRLDLVRTSCGFGVPLFEHRGERDTLDRWATSKTPEELAAYRREKNTTSLDGLPA
jgi:hypothetical protein